MHVYEVHSESLCSGAYALPAVESAHHIAQPFQMTEHLQGSDRGFMRHKSKWESRSALHAAPSCTSHLVLLQIHGVFGEKHFVAFLYGQRQIMEEHLDTALDHRKQTRTMMT